MRTYNVSAAVVALIDANSPEQAEDELRRRVQRAGDASASDGDGGFDFYEGPVEAPSGVHAFASEAL